MQYLREWLHDQRAVKTVAIGIAAIMCLCGCSTDPRKARQKFLESGAQFMKKAEYPAAIIQFLNALKCDNRSVETLQRLGEAYIGNRQPGEAQGVLARAVKVDPDRLDVRLMLGRLSLASGDAKNAEEQAIFVIARDPANASAHRMLGTAFMARKETEKARQAFEKAAALAPQDASSLVNLGLILAAQGSKEEAERTLRRAIEVDPRYLAGYSGLADHYRRLGKLAEAGKVFDSGIARNPEAIGLYLSAADLLMAQGENEAFEAMLNRLRERVRKPGAALALGDFFVSRNKRERAIAEYRLGLEIDPKDLQLKARLVEQHLAAGEANEAERWNAAILKVRPKDPGAGIARGRILFAQGKREEAIGELRRQVEQARDSAHAHYYLGLAYLHNQNPARARGEFQEAMKLAPGFLPVRLSLAELQMNMGELGGAREVAEATVRMFPASAAARMNYGNVLLRQHAIADSKQQLLAARKLAPMDPAVHVSLAIACVKERSWAEAETEFDAALKLNPRHTGALAGLAAMLMRNGQSAKAMARLERHAADWPEDAGGHLTLGSALRENKQYARAEAELARAVELNPKLIPARLQLGGTCQDQGRLDAAIRQYEAALELAPRSAVLHGALGTARLQKGEVAAARKHFEQGLAVDPNSAALANNLAYTHVMHGGNLDEAFAMAQRARQLAPDFVSAADTLGWIQYKKGLYPAAVLQLEHCTRKAPGSAVYRYHLGMALLAEGNKAKGKGQLEAALRLKLGGEDATQAHEALAKIR